MMDKQEFEQFKKTMESVFVMDKINTIEKEQILPLLSNMITFLTITKRYNELEKYLEKTNTSLSRYFLDNCSFREAYLNNGYLYHITADKNVESILENGLLTLNKRYNRQMFIDCRKVNKCWKDLMKRNKKTVTSLIVIPQHANLYKQRFNSVYLTTDFSFCWEYYGKGSELFRHYIRKLGKCLALKINVPKEELKEKIEKCLKEEYNVSEEEIQILNEFYDIYYDSAYLNDKVENRAIIMVPFQQANRKNKEAFCNYKSTIQRSSLFEKNIFKMVDIEHKGSIEKEGLIAIDVLEDINKKVKLKVRGNEIK